MQPWATSNEEREFFKQSTVSRLTFLEFFVCGMMDRFKITKIGKIIWINFIFG